MKIAIDEFDETRLVESLANGDHRAFRAIYDQYGKLLFRKILRLTKSGDVAEDILQETFVRLWEKRHTLNPALPIKPWLYKVAENLVYQFYRELSRDARLQEQVISWYCQENVVASEEILFAAERQELLQKALLQLTPMRRRVFELCKLEGTSYDEAATRLGISPSTVSNHLVKANASVRAFLIQHKDSLFVLLPIFLNRSSF